MIHLLNVQPAFSRHVAQHVSRELREDFHRERAAQALDEAQRLLDAAAVPHRVHVKVGDKAHCIVAAAHGLGCDRVVIATSRKSALVRAVEDSLASRLMECCPVPLEVIGGAPAGVIERVGIPAGLGAGVAWLWVNGS